MEDSYKGESAGKKLARLDFWIWTKSLLGEQEFAERKHVVLASREGGDIGVLLALGVPANHIVAVDRVPSAVEACRERWPDIDVRCGDIREVFRSNTHEVGSVFLDFCSPISRETMTVCRDIYESCVPNIVVGVAFLRGREHDSTDPLALIPGMNRRRLRVQRAYGRGMAYDFLARMGGKTAWRPREMLNEAKADFPDGEVGAASFRRAFVFAHAMTACCERHWPEVDLILDYQSCTKDSVGVPMTILVTRPRPVIHAVLDNRNRVRVPKFNSGRFAHRAVVASQDDVRRLALSGKMEGAEHLFLNIPPATIAAWRAHATRGTYERKSA